MTKKCQMSPNESSKKVSVSPLRSSSNDLKPRKQESSVCCTERKASTELKGSNLKLPGLGSPGFDKKARAELAFDWMEPSQAWMNEDARNESYLATNKCWPIFTHLNVTDNRNEWWTALLWMAGLSDRKTKDLIDQMTTHLKQRRSFALNRKLIFFLSLGQVI